MKRLLLILLALALIAMPAMAAPDYKALYEQALTDALAWQDKCFELSAEIGRVKGLAEDALRLHEDAERDCDLLRAEIARLTQELGLETRLSSCKPRSLSGLWAPRDTLGSWPGSWPALLGDT